jgi:eukaryotic-like serine/threonine-protein kinase
VHSLPAVANGIVYVGVMDASIYALNASTGALVWRNLTDNTDNAALDSSPAVTNGIVYVASGNGYVFAIHA